MRSALLFPRLAAVAILIPALGALTACRGSHSTHSDLTPLRVQLDWYPQPEHGGLFAAQLLGYYQAEGLDVSFAPLPLYGSGVQQVASGKADIGLGSSDAVLEWNTNGLPIVAIGATMQHDPQAIMIHKDSPVHDFKDLEGRTVAAQTGATWIKWVTLHYNLHQLRQVPSTLSIANFLADPNYVQQVFVTSEPFFAKQAGAEVRTLLISSSGYDPYRVQFTTRDFAAQHPDIVAKFVRATVRGWQSYLKDPEATNAYLLKLNPVLNPEQEAYTAKALRDGGFIDGGDATGAQVGHMLASRWQSTFEQLKYLGIVNAQLDPTTCYSLKFVP